MLSIHPNARTTPAVRAEIARSREPTGVLAQRYGLSSETHPQMAQARRRRLPGSLQPSSHAALESHRGRAGHRLRAAPGHRLSA